MWCFAYLVDGHIGVVFLLIWLTPSSVWCFAHLVEGLYHVVISTLILFDGSFGGVLLI